MKAPAPISVCAFKAVVVAEDGAGADVGACADAAVADVGEVVRLRAGFHGDFFTSTKLPMWTSRPDVGARPQPREWTDDRTLAAAALRDFPVVADDVTVGADVTRSSITTPGPMTTFGSIVTSRPITVS